MKQLHFKHIKLIVSYNKFWNTTTNFNKKKNENWRFEDELIICILVMYVGERKISNTL